eukprot:TRINITY_DN15857_c0_g1_i1.p2 TRINITY_DN15857_c0_g1~~TRINITY_DN15857_c0_g1_i1.p2  ORF type:complete len:157 (+),score=66.44 TRINITY_DN15857_c0_g1_i1:52-522(+)
MAGGEHPVDALMSLYDDLDLPLNDEEKNPRAKFRKEAEAVEKEPVRLPKLVPDSTSYSSTLAMLQRTKHDVEAFSKQFSVMGGIMTIPASTDLKRTVAQMFAHPERAEEISNAEYRRREDVYHAEKARIVELQAEQLQKDRVLLAKELELLSAMDR